MPAELLEQQQNTASGEPEIPARLIALNPAAIKRRLFVDRLARRVVSLGGATIIFCILAILVVIAVQVYPLFEKPSATLASQVRAAVKSPLRVGADEYSEIAHVVSEAGVSFFTLSTGARVDVDMPALGGATVTAVSSDAGDTFALGLSDGRIVPATVRYDAEFVEKRRRVSADVEFDEAISAVDGATIQLLAYVRSDAGPIAAVASGPRSIAFVMVAESESLMGGTTKEMSRVSIDLPLEGELSALVLDHRGEDLFVGSTRGEVLRIDLRDRASPLVAGAAVLPASTAPTAITTLQLLIGDRTLVVGDETGGVSTWQPLRTEDGAIRLIRVNDFEPHDSAVIACSPSRRDKGFLTLARSGQVHLHYGTTGKTLLRLPLLSSSINAIAYAPKADGLAAIDAEGNLFAWRLDNRHPEITLKSLFGKVWYEGYDAPGYVWQSTGGTDDFEAKFSLTPLIFGTLKGTLYALLFAVPLALLSALYVSQFMHPDIRARVKPIVEIMAALPSVVLGFIAGLWLAPYMERIVPGIFVMPFVTAAVILLALACARGRLRSGREILLIVPAVLVGGWLAFMGGGWLEYAALGGDYRYWLKDVFGITFDQRNSLVVGFAMGFAVIPIIFTIAEDSLSSVPNHLKAASLALGATPWQTAIHVVLPTASPGIFSAIMIGFGRAVGETMIVLMATGNTPVMNWSVFNGFRALSANIAVELPEAPEGGTLFRVLFLAALLLFALTFVMNTAAEVIRLRLRKKYRVL